jgi:3-hydroxyisobutyrate dehydrogenase-like beta-hydroxyacid dehydrogenase
MSSQRIGILHPGAMGISVAAAAQHGGCQVSWVSAGRSPATRERAAAHGLRDAGTLAALCAECQIIVSVCPPHAAQSVAREVLASGFTGLYADVNAISPQRSQEISRMLEQAGIGVVDGGIIGGPAWTPGRTWLYLSGPRAGEVAACFAAGPLAAQVLGAQIGSASALKMCYAAYTKGTTALLCAILETAEGQDVREALEQQWDRDEQGFAANVAQRVRRVTATAWRFAGEMDEIADTFRETGLPGEFHAAAAIVYRRLAHFKDAPALPALDEVLGALLGNHEAAKE